MSCERSHPIIQPLCLKFYILYSAGVSEIMEEQLPPRLSLRFLASYRCLFLIVISFAVGYMTFGGMLPGFLGVCCIYFSVLIAFALLSDN